MLVTCFPSYSIRFSIRSFFHPFLLPSAFPFQKLGHEVRMGIVSRRENQRILVWAHFTPNVKGIQGKWRIRLNIRYIYIIIRQPPPVIPSHPIPRPPFSPKPNHPIPFSKKITANPTPPSPSTSPHASPQTPPSTPPSSRADNASSPPPSPQTPTPQSPSADPPPQTPQPATP